MCLKFLLLHALPAATSRLANWGRPCCVRFSPSGERFAAIGEGGVVATWRLDAASRWVLLVGASPVCIHV